MKFSREITGIAVIDFLSGQELGKVKEWLLDKSGRFVIAFVADGGGWLPQSRLFSFGEIAGFGRDAIMVAGQGEQAAGDPPTLDGRETCRVLGKRMLSADGTELGIVEDILFDEETGRVAGWRLSTGLIDDLLQGRPVLNEPLLLTMGEDALIISD
ncbi:MAG: PRC-barrel domain-containing protein [Bacillota bacterium]|nr:PRC-barrel domain-containing protein [Bacillota bacterium]HHU30192.1 hypothetical protein [Bacillota bacterium]